MTKPFTIRLNLFKCIMQEFKNICIRLTLQYISTSVMPAQSCLTSFGLFIGQPFTAFTYPFKDFGLPFNTFTYPFKDFSQPFKAFIYRFKYLSQTFNALSYPFMDFGQPFKLFTIRLNRYVNRLSALVIRLQPFYLPI